MGPEGIILVNPPITTLQQSLTHSAMMMVLLRWFIIFGSWPPSSSNLSPMHLEKLFSCYLPATLFHKMSPLVKTKCAWNLFSSDFFLFLFHICFKPGSSSLSIAISIVFFGPIFSLLLSCSGSRLTFKCKWRRRKN